MEPTENTSGEVRRRSVLHWFVIGVAVFVIGLCVLAMYLYYSYYFYNEDLRSAFSIVLAVYLAVVGFLFWFYRRTMKRAEPQASSEDKLQWLQRIIWLVNVAAFLVLSWMIYADLDSFAYFAIFLPVSVLFFWVYWLNLKRQGEPATIAKKSSTREWIKAIVTEIFQVYIISFALEVARVVSYAAIFIFIFDKDLRTEALIALVVSQAIVGTYRFWKGTLKRGKTESRDKGKNQFERLVFPAELEEISRRRHQLGIDNSAVFTQSCAYLPRDGSAVSSGAKKKEEKEKISIFRALLARLKAQLLLTKLRKQDTPASPAGEVDRQPSTKQALVGLALSGGGIRSATFSLGVIQALWKYDVLKFVDYLSTVSGGGYIGSCLSSTLNNENATTIKAGGAAGSKEFPFYYKTGRGEPRAMVHLRNSSKYLASGGLFGKLRLPTLLIRGILINLWIILPWVLLAVLATHALHQYFHQPLASFIYGYGPFVALALFGLMVITFPIGLSRKRRWDTRNSYELLTAYFLLVALVLILLVPLFELIHQGIAGGLQFRLPRGGTLLQDPRTWGVIVLSLGLLVLFMFSGRAATRISQWGGKLALYALGVIGPTLIFFAYLFLCSLWLVVLPQVSDLIATEYRLPLNMERADLGRAKESLNKGFVSPALRQIGETQKDRYEGVYEIRLAADSIADVVVTDKVWKTKHHYLQGEGTIELYQLFRYPVEDPIERLNAGVISDRLRLIFQANNVILSESARVVDGVRDTDGDSLAVEETWTIEQGGRVSHLLRRDDTLWVQTVFSHDPAGEPVELVDGRSLPLGLWTRFSENGVWFARDDEYPVMDLGQGRKWRIDGDNRDIVLTRAQDEGAIQIEVGFSFSLNAAFADSLNAGRIPPLLRQVFDDNRVRLSRVARIYARPDGTGWDIEDHDSRHRLVKDSVGIMIQAHYPLPSWIYQFQNVDSLEADGLNPLLREKMGDYALSETPTITPVANGAESLTRAWDVDYGGNRRFLLTYADDGLFLIGHDIKYTYLALIILFLLLVNMLLFNQNITSAHGFYRDRLSKAYLIGENERGELEHQDEQKLSDLNKRATTAPYHLINVALNLHGSDDPNLRGRNADFFIFSKHYTGSLRTGFCKTRDLESYDRHVNLGTAMAISGAAASPNMGTTTIKPLVFIMTLLNIRLGYWLPHPYTIADLARWKKNVEGYDIWTWAQIGQALGKRWKEIELRFGIGSRYLFREALGDLNASRAFINVSDGGHLENLGLYELLRRRCRFIIAVDGEADPQLQCASLLRLIRFARIDVGVEIDIDLDGIQKLERRSRIRKQKERYSNQHWALGTIEYSDDQTGYLLYIKASLTGDENDYVREYKARNPSFPHESTANQFFNETQFEAYRELGYHVANELFKNQRVVTDEKKTGQPPQIVEQKEGEEVGMAVKAFMQQALALNGEAVEEQAATPDPSSDGAKAAAEPAVSD